jgi:predicted RNA methylase
MVLDPIVGGGSVAAAALTLGRKFIGIDIDRNHIETSAAEGRGSVVGDLRYRFAGQGKRGDIAGFA